MLGLDTTPFLADPVRRGRLERTRNNTSVWSGKFRGNGKPRREFFNYKWNDCRGPPGARGVNCSVQLEIGGYSFEQATKFVLSDFFWELKTGWYQSRGFASIEL